MKKTYGEYELTEEVAAEIQRVSQEEEIYEKLASSIAPEIFGHDDVKKALLLQLVGGCTQHRPDGMKIRGDIHMCLMGDPGVAKSQLLKYISTVAPRGVYTTGKGSSGVGLTAAVVRDQFTQELTLEGGALVLADQGVCCIDEFDKMEESDRTAIHEVMEQQTVSIAKAGITTTLNARTAVLAAANPLYGRYNMKRSMAENINLPAALLSRFDLLFLLRDQPDREKDTNLARHVTHVHRFSAHPEIDYTPLEPSFLRYYIAMARRWEPYFTPELSENIANTYVEMRQGDGEGNFHMHGSSDSENQFTTPRMLLSVLRLSQALARLRFTPVVSQEDVDEALRLMVKSKSSLHDEQHSKTDKKSDPMSDIYHAIRNYAQNKDVTRISYTDAERLTLEAGCATDQLEETLKMYAGLGVWQVSADKSSIIFSY
jgi:DNA replication licensing factor MCM7